MYTYRIVLNVSTRFYFSVYANNFTGASCMRASFATPEHHAFYLGHRQLRQCQLYNPRFLVLERNQLLLRFVSTCDNHAVVFSTVNHVHNLLRYSVPFCIAVCIPVRVGLLNVPCYASLGTVLSTLCVHHIYRAGSIDSVGRSRWPKNA